MVAAVLIAGTVAVTSAHLSRMRLLDVADGAALSAANALDDAAYREGVGTAVPLSNASVRERAAAYVGGRPAAGKHHAVAPRRRHRDPRRGDRGRRPHG